MPRVAPPLPLPLPPEGHPVPVPVPVRDSLPEVTFTVPLPAVMPSLVLLKTTPMVLLPEALSVPLLVKVPLAPPLIVAPVRFHVLPASLTMLAPPEMVRFVVEVLTVAVAAFSRMRVPPSATKQPLFVQMFRPPWAKVVPAPFIVATEKLFP